MNILVGVTSLMQLLVMAIFLATKIVGSLDTLHIALVIRRLMIRSKLLTLRRCKVNVVLLLLALWVSAKITYRETLVRLLITLALELTHAFTLTMVLLLFVGAFVFL